MALVIPVAGKAEIDIAIAIEIERLDFIAPVGRWQAGFAATKLSGDVGGIIDAAAVPTVIAEASEFSGSLITARLTLEQDRELWAVPGNITGKGSYGPNYLIKQGAHVVLDVQDIMDELPVRVLDQLKTPVQVEECTVGTETSAAKISGESRKVLGAVPVDQTVHFDQLLEELEFSLSELNQMLLELEMNNLIRQLPGRRFSRRL